MKKTTLAALATFLTAVLAVCCTRPQEPGAEPTGEIITIRYHYRNLAQALTIAEDPDRLCYYNLASFYCYDHGSMVLFSPLHLDSSFFEPLTLPVHTWSILPYSGPQDS